MKKTIIWILIWASFILVGIVHITSSIEFIKLESDTWYYQYEIDKELYISTTAPKKDNEESRNWYHPEKGYKCLGGFYIADPEASDDIQE